MMFFLWGDAFEIDELGNSVCKTKAVIVKAHRAGWS